MSRWFLNPHHLCGPFSTTGMGVARTTHQPGVRIATEMVLQCSALQEMVLSCEATKIPITFGGHLFEGRIKCKPGKQIQKTLPTVPGLPIAGFCPAFCGGLSETTFAISRRPFQSKLGRGSQPPAVISLHSLQNWPWLT